MGHPSHMKLKALGRKCSTLFYRKTIEQNYGEKNRATKILVDNPSHTESPPFTVQEISEHSEHVQLRS